MESVYNNTNRQCAGWQHNSGQNRTTESKGMSFKPKVITFETNKEFSWLGTVLFSGLFDGLHKFELIDNGNGTTTFKQSEQFNGLLVGLFNLDNTKKGFESMNNKLKEIAEQ